jgi:uncharacterized protein YxjI
MKTFTVTQKILSLGATYLVTPEGTKDPVYVIKGKILTMSPKLEMRKNDQGEILKTMKGNFIGTKFTIFDKSGSEDGLIQFPFFSIIAKFTLTSGTASYAAKGGFMARNFECKDQEGKVKFTISKEWAFRDKFTVSLEEPIAETTAILAAVAIDQRFFQKKS